MGSEPTASSAVRSDVPVLSPTKVLDARPVTPAPAIGVHPPVLFVGSENEPCLTGLLRVPSDSGVEAKEARLHGACGPRCKF
jgi:hypothetical protein